MSKEVPMKKDKAARARRIATRSDAHKLEAVKISGEAKQKAKIFFARSARDLRRIEANQVSFTW